MTRRKAKAPALDRIVRRLRRWSADVRLLDPAVLRYLIQEAAHESAKIADVGYISKRKGAMTLEQFRDDLLGTKSPGNRIREQFGIEVLATLEGE